MPKLVLVTTLRKGKKDVSVLIDPRNAGYAAGLKRGKRPSSVLSQVAQAVRSTLSTIPHSRQGGSCSRGIACRGGKSRQFVGNCPIK